MRGGKEAREACDTGLAVSMVAFSMLCALGGLEFQCQIANTLLSHTCCNVLH